MTTALRRLIGALLTVSSLLVPRPIAAAPHQVAVLGEDVPVAGGTVALARAIGIEPVPDPARLVTELVRLIYAQPKENRESRDSTLRRLIAYCKSAGPTAHGARVDLVPMPLTALMWSQSVFHRAIAPGELFAAVMSDEAAALLAYGLAALDDETLQFFEDHPAVIARLYEHDAAVFGAFSEHLHIRNGRVVVPGSDTAVPLWEAILNEKATQPARFAIELFAKRDGRIAYLYDTIGHLDPGRAAFALGLWIEDPAERIIRFKALASATASAFREWDATRYPFARPTHDLVSMLSRARVGAGGAPGFPASRAVWARAFEAAPRGGEETPDVVATSRRGWGPGAIETIDAAWLAETIVSGGSRSRPERIDQFAFGERVFAAADDAALPDVVMAIRAFPRFRMLMLTLERIGVSRPSVYAALAKQAQRLSGIGPERGRTALAQFQGATALVARLVHVRTIDVATAETLLVTLAAVPLDRDGRYAGGVAQWLDQRLHPVLAPRSGMEATLVDALAGVPGTVVPDLISWEGQQYRLDLVGPEAQRLRRIRERQIGTSIDAALDLYAAARGEFARGLASQSAELIVERADVALGEALLAMSYAVDLGDSQSKPGLAISIARRHDFGLARTDDEDRIRAAWALPRQMMKAGVPWHVEGAALGLDIALAPLTLRRIHAAPLARAPAISSTERETFAASVALLNPFALLDGARDSIADAVARGERRVEAAACGDEDVNALASEIRMDGRRVRALTWTIAHDPARARSFFSMIELLYLGGGGSIESGPWGMSALGTTGCLCTEIATPGAWAALAGRPSIGLLAAAVADVNLRVAVVLHELGLPAALARAVLEIAVREFVDDVKPSDIDDWLTLVRTAQDIPRERIEDYVAIATAGGPLVPETSLKQ
jgi:hypothetical protein